MSITLLIIILTCLTSILAFRNPAAHGAALFYPYAMRERGEWYRFLTSGFVHVDWMHLLVNMYVLYIFGTLLEDRLLHTFFGTKVRLVYVLLYLGGMVISDVPSYFRYRHDPGFRAVGASGAVSSVVFASILINPWQGGIGLLFLPGLSIPPLIFGGLYLLYSAVMSRRQGGRVHHDAHLYGALFGLLLPGLLDPRIFRFFLQQWPF